MDNLTHTLVGLAGAKAGLERTSPYATLVCVVAANLPDADIVTLLGGRWTYLHQHRGLSHSIVGTLVLSLLLPLVFYGGERLVARLRGVLPRAHLRGLLLSSLVMGASHPLLDWTNNYGVRPLLPWDARWFYGDLVFILDPWLWLLLGGAVFLLTSKTRLRSALWAGFALALTALIFYAPGRSANPLPTGAYLLWLAGIAGLVFAHRARLAARWGGAIAVAALALVVVYWAALSLFHARAQAQAETVAASVARQRSETLLRVAAMPTLANPLRWFAVAETDRALLRFNVALGDDAATSEPHIARFDKPPGDAAQIVARAARDDERAAIFLDFARFPAVRTARDCASQTLVQFADLRFAVPGDARGTFTLEIPVADGGD